MYCQKTYAAAAAAAAGDRQLKVARHSNESSRGVFKADSRLNSHSFTLAFVLSLIGWGRLES